MTDTTFATGMIEIGEKPPQSSGSPVEWLRRNMFSSKLDTSISIICIAVATWVISTLVSWALVNSVWSAEAADQCRAATGACWAVIDARARIILFGLYPYDEHWRSALACLVIVLVVIASCLPAFWSARRLTALWVGGFGLFYLLMRGGILGLSDVTPDRWGGLSLTVFIFASVSLIGMPLSIALALARRSRLPAISRMAALLIDTIRSLPLLTILFTAALILPFALPGFLQGDKLYRVILGFALFFACYQAENIRAGMQAIPGGQEEAAMSLGLNYWQRMSRIILPQAFKNALPPTINQFVITFKETAIISIVGFFDILSSGQAAFGTAAWAPYYAEVYVFIALIYFVFVFSLSRYGAYLEKRMRVGHD